jgi:hypothetical protein
MNDSDITDTAIQEIAAILAGRSSAPSIRQPDRDP